MRRNAVQRTACTQRADVRHCDVLGKPRCHELHFAGKRRRRAERALTARATQPPRRAAGRVSALTEHSRLKETSSSRRLTSRLTFGEMYASLPRRHCAGVAPPSLTRAWSLHGDCSLLPHLHWEWAHPSNNCTGTGLTPAHICTRTPHGATT